MKERRMNRSLQWLLYGRRGIRSGWKILIFMGLSILIAGIFVVGSTIALSGWISVEDQNWDSMYLIVIHVMLIASLLLSSFIMLRFFDHRSFAMLGVACDPGWTGHVLLGMTAGFIAICIIIAAGILLGAYTMSLRSIDTALLIKAFSRSVMTVFIYALFEEILFHGYLLQMLIEGTGRITAILVLSILFGILHYLNPNGSLLGAINTGLAGAALAVAYVRTRSLLFPIAMHFSWNFTLGFLFGFPVSGIGFDNTPLIARVSGVLVLSGGSFGPEASIVSTVVLSALIVFFILFRNLQPSDVMVSRWERSHQY